MTAIKNVITPLSANPAALKEYHRLVRTFGAEEAKVQLARNFNVAPTLQEVAGAEREAAGAHAASLNPFERAHFRRQHPEVYSSTAGRGTDVEELERAKHPYRGVSNPPAAVPPESVRIQERRRVMNPHFSTDKTARETFARLMKPFLRGTGNPLAAVGAVLGAGFSILESDVPTPLLDAYAKLPDEVAKGHYARDNATAISNERQALQLVRGQEAVRRQVRERAEKAKAADREAEIERRVAVKRDAQRARLDAEFRAEAEREAEEKLGAAPAPESPTEPTEPAPSPPGEPEPVMPSPGPKRSRRAA